MYNVHPSTSCGVEDMLFIALPIQWSRTVIAPTQVFHPRTIYNLREKINDGYVNQVLVLKASSEDQNRKIPDLPRQWWYTHLKRNAFILIQSVRHAKQFLRHIHSISIKIEAENQRAHAHDHLVLAHRVECKMLWRILKPPRSATEMSRIVGDCVSASLCITVEIY